MPSINSLSTELVLMVADCLRSARDKLAFARTSKRFLEATNNRLYLFNRDHQGSSAVFWAIQDDERLPTLQFLHEMGFDIDSSAGCSTFVPAQRPELFGKSEKFDWDFTPLHLAAFLGQLQTTAWLLDHGAKVDAGAHNLCCCREEPVSPFGRRFSSKRIHPSSSTTATVGQYARRQQTTEPKPSSISSTAASSKASPTPCPQDGTTTPCGTMQPRTWNFSALRLLFKLEKKIGDNMVPTLTYTINNGFYGAALILAEEDKRARTVILMGLDPGIHLNATYLIPPHAIHWEMSDHFPRWPTETASYPAQKALWESQKMAFFTKVINMVENDKPDYPWLLLAKSAMEELHG
ncbi:hypothetical protein B0T22DRAFT_444983 [Podospora appendiculata]|uniref:Uncharacterized protein n=1 Tax=Podospora appendiculata TaxID=314037 RepID=A0AAE1C8I0_9PEZI|nr:hypothetical protein B0T22DRAFT_444983 [Podospora appendiculata]